MSCPECGDSFTVRGFNPRPPKRTLCPAQPAVLDTTDPVSIHVLRRGRCVSLIVDGSVGCPSFQSTSSEEDVVSQHFPQYLYELLFQSTSSEEDVVSGLFHLYSQHLPSFNPRPPKRTLCLHVVKSRRGSLIVSIHVLRRGRCVLFVRRSRD